MRRMLAVLLICLLGCGGGSFRGTLRSASTVFSVTGFVSIIEITTLPGTTIPVTIVTFLPDFGSATTVIFSANLTQQFLLDGFTTVEFTQGPGYATASVIFIN